MKNEMIKFEDYTIKEWLEYEYSDEDRIGYEISDGYLENNYINRINRDDNSIDEKVIYQGINKDAETDYILMMAELIKKQGGDNKEIKFISPNSKMLA